MIVDDDDVGRVRCFVSLLTFFLFILSTLHCVRMCICMCECVFACNRNVFILDVFSRLFTYTRIECSSCNVLSLHMNVLMFTH